MKKLLLFVLLPLLLLIGAGAGAFVAGLIPGFGGAPEAELTAEQKAEQERIANTAPSAAKPSPVGAVFHTLDEFVVNLRSNTGYPVFLLLSLTVELPNEGAIQVVQAQEPRIRDALIVYLSSLTPQQLNGYDGIQKVRNNAWRLLRELVGPDTIVNVQIAKLTVK
ncbi:flagellar basal body-associated FliL family protein [Thalassobaculum salexigens]|uniref:flagellar basal body-associated FliL family protein n=1 Tax=Thalassobaculum salexigens TaxID=455360 RepID=UPI00041EDFED|nr:flagellar basal body-associated FliL family protein [Thalassobaculum salexigens]